MKILLLIFGITLFGCSWTSKPEKKSSISENYSFQNVKQENPKKTKQAIDSILRFDQLEIGKRTLYTGGGKTDRGETKINGIYIKKIADNKIEYSYSQLINWKKEFDKNGIAELTSISDSILTIKELKEPTYMFIDFENDIIIYVTKNERINITKAKVFNKAGKQISELMYNK
ncbi:hypothetical protein H3Z83_08345 [Tenacibaculum sp. S7007]|uniref:Lipoprotein n=1 Tax=Tenacibaculum pelagium TaxID=2759527 RepID=A0A839AQL0_9FLAO|nr:hypothetical protein [Tenacibaculum pelagium]MBA6156519.1 hypothetical protein [Tenacibaculum pelagium]